MNKKISTLLAAFLAAGYCMTAEAGVVKVTTPKSGQAYVIGADGLVTIAASQTQLQNSAAGAVAFTTGSNTGDVASKSQWRFDGAIDGNFSLYNVEKGKYLEDEGDNAQYGSSAVNFTYAATKITSTANPSNKLTATAAVASFGTTGTALYFYAITERVPASVAGDAFALKFGDKYLYVSGVADASVVSLIDQAQYETTLKGAEPWRVQWSASAAGIYKSAYSIASLYLKVASNDFQVTTSEPTNDFWSVNETEGIYGQEQNTEGTFKYLLSSNGTADGNITVAADPSGNVTMSLTQVALPQTGDAAATKDSYDLAENIVAGEYYLLSGNNATGYVSQSSNSTAATVVAAGVADANAYWKVSYSGGYYSFVNKNGISLKIGNATKFKPNADYHNGFRLHTDDADSYINIATTTISLATASAAASASNPQILGLYSLGSAAYKASELMAEYNTYFDLLLKDEGKTTDQLQSNPFYGKDLVPMKIEGTAGKYTLKEATGNEEAFLLRTTSGNYIVLDLDNKWSIAGIDQHVTAGGYKFATLTAANMLAFLNQKGNADLLKRKLGFTFQIKHSAVDDSAIQTIEVVNNAIAVDDDYMHNDVTGQDIVYYMASFNSDKKTYLTVNTEKKNLVYAALQKQTVVLGTDAKNNPLLSRYVNISFVNKVSDAWTGKYSIEDGGVATLNGKVLGIKKDGSYKNTGALVPISSEKNLANRPEGQWFVKMTEAVDGTKAADIDNKKFTFVNRENPEKVLEVMQMFSLGDNKYAVEYADQFNSFCNNGAGRDTLLLAPVKPGIESDTVLINGYKDYTAADVKDQEFRLSVASTSEVDYYVTENHNVDHLLGLSKDVADAVNWKLVRMDAKRVLDNDGYVGIPTDSVYVINNPQRYASDGKYYEYVDTLATITYALQNTENGEYLTYDPSQDYTAMMCKEKSANYTSKDLNDAYRFVIREKADGLVNLLGVSRGEEYYSLDLDKKLYGATTYKSTGAVEIESVYAQINSNDLFKVTPVEAKEYVKKAQGDVIRIFCAENDYDVMYENGEFLNLGNKAQLTNMKPALYVDTAYVNRDGNNRYQYLLAVNPTRVEAEFDNAGHLLSPDTTYGRFLVNLVDTAVYAYKNGAIHTNKYINEKEANETYVKLGFVWGFRTGDKLYVTADNKFKKDDKRVIGLGTPDFNVAKFAFQYVNPTSSSDKSFKIQTRYVDYATAIKDKNLEHNNGYLKTINGVVVVTSTYADGEEFSLEAEESALTANDNINASEVSVIAKEGEVIINGAAGKKVVITNVLGQTVANTVLSSDNATLSAPAGIVVVAVEGEAAVKAIVK